jgi:hypothetical protein
MKWRRRESGQVRRTFFWTFLQALAALLLLLLASPFVRAQNFQSWNEVDLTGAWTNVDFLVPLLARVDSSLPNPQLAATGVTAEFRLPWHLTFTGGYLFAVVPQRSLDVHLPIVAITPSFRLRRFVLADRNRFEKLIGFPGSPVRYRNRLLVDAPFGPNERWHAFIEDEVIFNITAGGWSQNRFQLGCGQQLAPRLFLDVYYLRRNVHGVAQATHVLGTTLRISLRARKQRKDDRKNG